MLRRTPQLRNTYLTASVTRAPITVIRSGRRFWTQPERMIRQKTLYFTLGMDSQPLRRVAVLAADKERHRNAFTRPLESASSAQDVTGFQRKRAAQIIMWHRRIQYQEYYIQHLVARHVWGLLRMYPPGGAKIPGRSELGYFADDNGGVHRYARTNLPAKPLEIYERRKWLPSAVSAVSATATATATNASA